MKPALVRRVTLNDYAGYPAEYATYELNFKSYLSLQGLLWLFVVRRKIAACIPGPSHFSYRPRQKRDTKISP
jgi:hypothetical protein